MNIYDKIVLTYAQSVDYDVNAEQLKDGRWVAPISVSLEHADLANAPILPQEEYGRLKADVPVVEVQPSLPLDSFVDKE
jgi:hypothetical protein